MHILHNITKDLETNLFHWKDFVRMLHHVARLLAQTWTRRRLLATCFVDPPHHHYAADFDGFNHHVYEGRWGEAVAAVNDLLPVAGPYGTHGMYTSTSPQATFWTLMRAVALTRMQANPPR